VELIGKVEVRRDCWGVMAVVVRHRWISRLKQPAEEGQETIETESARHVVVQDLPLVRQAFFETGSGNAKFGMNNRLAICAEYL